MADALERITNLIALLLETNQPVTLEQIVNELGQYPAGEGAQRGAFERDKALLRDLGVPIESRVLAGSDAGNGPFVRRCRRAGHCAPVRPAAMAAASSPRSSAQATARPALSNWCGPGRAGAGSRRSLRPE